MMSPDEPTAAGNSVPALRREYLDLLILAGRLQRGTETPRDPLGQDAVAVRSWILTRIKDARSRMRVRHFAGAPPEIVEAEIIIVAFLDSAAARLFGLRVWRSLREELHRDYIEHIDGQGRGLGVSAQRVIDLGKYVFDRFEVLRAHAERLAAEPTELLSIYDYCLRLGYDATYSDPALLQDFAGKLRAELRSRAEQSAAALVGRSNGRSGAPRPEQLLSPDLPPLEGPQSRLPALNPTTILAMGAVLLLVTAGMLLGILRRDEKQLQHQANQTATALSRQAQGAPEQVCANSDSRRTDAASLAQRSTGDGQ